MQHKIRKSPLRARLFTLLMVLAAAWTVAFSLEPLGGGFGHEDSLYAAANQHLKSSVRSSHSVAAPGDWLTLAIEVTMDEGFWLYGPVPRGVVQPRPLSVTVEAGDLRSHSPLFERPAVHPSGEGAYYDEHFVYLNQTVIYIPLEVPPEAAPGSHTIRTTLRGQLCDVNRCLEIKQTGEVAVTVGQTAVPEADFPPPDTAHWKTAAQWETQLPQIPVPQTQAKEGPVAQPVMLGASLTLWAAIGLALLAGVGLNIMPCVLPVLPLKVLSILYQAHQSRRRAVTLGMAYAGGMLSFFLILAAASVALRLTTGLVLNLNEPFKYPAFIIGLALLLVVLALWLFNVYSISVGSRLAAGGPRQGHAGSAFMGLLTALLATPCSGPVLVVVFGWAQGQPAWAGAAAFTALGVGMAAPHALLASFPRWLERLPRPGAWMERFKQGLGFVLLLVAVWLVSVLGDAHWIGWVMAYAVVLSLCVWAAGTWVNYDSPASRKWLVRLGAAAVAVAAGFWMLPRPSPPAIDWQPFDVAAIQRARQEGKTVLVEFTADWCTVCKIVEFRVYNRQDTADALRQRGVVAIRGDVARNDSPATRYLTEELREPGPPVTVVYSPRQKAPTRLHGVFSRDELLSALDAAAGKE